MKQIVLENGRILSTKDEFCDWLQECGMSPYDVDALIQEQKDAEHLENEYKRVLDKSEELEWAQDAYTNALNEIDYLLDDIKKMTKDKFVIAAREVINGVI